MGEAGTRGAEEFLVISCQFLVTQTQKPKLFWESEE
jgi:hypothetical protein